MCVCSLSLISSVSFLPSCASRLNLPPPPPPNLNVGYPALGLGQTGESRGQRVCVAHHNTMLLIGSRSSWRLRYSLKTYVCGRECVCVCGDVSMNVRRRACDRVDGMDNVGRGRERERERERDLEWQM